MIVSNRVVSLLSGRQNVNFLFFCQVFWQLRVESFHLAKLTSAYLNSSAHNLYCSRCVINNWKGRNKFNCVFLRWTLVLKLWLFQLYCLMHNLSVSFLSCRAWSLFNKYWLSYRVIDQSMLHFVHLVFVFIIRVKTVLDSLVWNVVSLWAVVG